MNKLIFILCGLIGVNAVASDITNGPLQQHPALCNYGYNPNCGQNNETTPPKKIIRHITVNVPSQYGALALDEKTSSLGSSNNHSSLAEAKKAAIRQCGEKGCKVITWVKNGCIAAAGGKVGSKWKLTKAAEERGEAEQVAMSHCRKAGISDCTIVVPETCSIPDISKY